MAPRVLSLLAGSLSLAPAVTALPGRATADPAPPTGVGVVPALSDGTHPTVQGSAGWARLGDQRRDRDVRGSVRPAGDDVRVTTCG